MRHSNRTAALLLCAAVTLCAAAPTSASMLTVTNFQDSTGIRADAKAIGNAWSALQAMGTTEFLGGLVGNFKLDEASMVAGALTIGASEFDRFLRGGSLASGSASLGNALSSAMGKAAGIDLSGEIGSFTSGGGFTSGSGDFASLAGLGGAVSGGGMCDPEVATLQAEAGKARVESMVTAGLSKEYGFSQLAGLKPSSGKGSGFSAMSCLDKLFQNAGSDIMFKPPNLGNLTTQLQNWTCGKQKSVDEQVASAFGGGEIFDTGALGGFFPALTYGEAMEGSPSPRPGMGATATETFGAAFGQFKTASAAEVQKSAGLGSLFK